jgi:Bacterial SH3 domain
VDDSRRTLPGVPVERPASLGTQSAAVPAWVFVLLVALPVAAGWFVALSLDLSWVRASAGARVATARGPVASDRGTNVPDAPTAAAPTPDSRPAPGPGEAARVAHTDGQGVVLRTAPREDARVPRGLLEGARVTVIERPEGEWAQVRGETGLEGWVPIEFLAAPD